MEALLRFTRPPAIAILRPPLTCSSKKRVSGLRAKLDDSTDPLLQAAINSASLRYQETHRPDPLFLDTYAGCFVPPPVQTDIKQHSDHYCLATRFLDDALLRTVNHIDGFKQVVLFTDGMDTRPYRLGWPASTLIFDISPERVFNRAAQKLQDIGARIPRNCLFFHVAMESLDIQQTLCAKGFTGDRPSIWVIQGFPVMTLANFEDILVLASNLAMSGCYFLGEMPAWLTQTEFGTKSTTRQWMNKLFMSNGFKADMISFEDVARDLHKQLALRHYNKILFAAEQLRLSDDQMRTFWREFQRLEEQGDEDGFEEL
ncbi:hypothetical protein SO802_033226 [Lithocarpus litseifolius]|uniref:S-adenosyl-L-methionine-dependent methyltransferase n=1 Tax=Lithocarpus litseifolius TaxID=425828 RepID=A0AAW2BCC1_9ROSI